ncbi:MAG: hypothetical protein M0C28_19475 [Candidatus Moduliflexus flocculans]|nr:hypothetical protein [Candidatus Moduliflexus flocculans]
MTYKHHGDQPEARLQRERGKRHGPTGRSGSRRVLIRADEGLQEVNVEVEMGS